jgi:hypothetical protein
MATCNRKGYDRTRILHGRNNIAGDGMNHTSVTIRNNSLFMVRVQGDASGTLFAMLHSSWSCVHAWGVQPGGKEKEGMVRERYGAGGWPELPRERHGGPGPSAQTRFCMSISRW